MKINRRLLTAAIAGLLMSTGPTAHAVEPVRIVVAFPPGGPVDIVARTLAEPLGQTIGAPVIVDNRPGANGNIAATHVARSAKDGNTLFLTSVGAVAISPALYAQLPYDPAKDFAPITRVVNNATVFVVTAGNPATDAADFVRRAKASAQPPAIGSSGVGSIPHLTLEMFQEATGVRLTHVPYKGAAQVVTDVIGGHADGFFGDLPGLIGQIRAGTLKPLGVASAQPQKALPNVKTLAQQGIAGVESNNWYGLLAPAGTAPAIVQRLNQAVRDVLARPAVQTQLEEYGAQVAPSTPQELAALIASDRQKWSGLIQRKNIQP